GQPGRRAVGQRGLTGITNPALGMNLAPVADWSVQQPFLDVMKTARPWIGHLPGQWGGWDHDDLARGGWLGPGGWPTAVPPQLQAIATVVLNDLPAEARSTAGRYRVTWQGEGSLRVDGRARVVSARPGEILFDFDPGPGAVIVTIAETDPARRGRPIRDIRIVAERHRAAAEAGEIFNPDWIARIAGANPLRFMDWLATNGATLARAEDRPRPQDYTWARQGVPVEVIAALANRLQADPWITLPHTAEPDLIADWAAVFRDRLDPGLRVWVEFSNELWNWVFPQAHWAQEGARREWGRDAAWVEYATLAAARAMQTWTRAYGPTAPDRVVRVVGVQTGWLGLEDQMLGSPRVRAALGGDPAGYFDAYAVTGYFGGMLGDPERLELLKSWLAEGPAAAEARALAALADGTGLPGAEGSLDHLLTVLLPHHAARARDWGLDLVMYEGGTHVAGVGPVASEADVTAFFTALNYTPGMAALHDRLIAGWAALGAGPFVYYYDVGGPGWHGSWGALRHLWDDNPRWRAVAGGCGGC
ncbi:MAG: hypothetical protein IE927_16150, partial [Rhodobacterales bacterium]|nr:hypothetical protein [Rhodobacterales bacterium]